MGVSFISRQFPTTQALEDYANTRLSRALKHFDNGDVSITMEKSGPHLYQARACSKIGGQPIVAHATSKDMYVAVARASLKLQRLMDKKKGRSKSHDSPTPLVTTEEDPDENLGD